VSDTWSLKLREEYRLRVFENRVLEENISTEEARNGVWRKLHNEELHNFYYLPSVNRMMKSGSMRWGRQCTTHGREEDCI
jgi:hypothetical protein